MSLLGSGEQRYVKAISNNNNNNNVNNDNNGDFSSAQQPGRSEVDEAGVARDSVIRMLRVYVPAYLPLKSL